MTHRSTTTVSIQHEIEGEGCSPWTEAKAVYGPIAALQVLRWRRTGSLTFRLLTGGGAFWRCHRALASQAKRYLPQAAR